MNAIKPRSAPSGLTAAFVLLSVLFVASLTGAGLSLYQVVQSGDYREVSGTIVEHDYSRARAKSGETQRQRESRQKTVFFNVNYRYTVDGTEYVGNRIQPGTFGMISAANKRDFEQRFPVGTQVPVYVDPSDPNTAVLVRGWSHVTTMLSVLSLFFATGCWILGKLRRAFMQPPASRLPG
jgi:hypothetical protein